MTLKLKLILGGLTALGAILIVGVLVYFIGAPHRAHVQATLATAGSNSAVASRNAATDTVRIVVEGEAVHGQIALINQGNVNAIRNAPGASAAVDPAVHAAGLRALRMYKHPDSLQPSSGGLLNPGP